ncbi:YhcN/YlaJ family sporulation lipoprotein [Gracilibacillus sp. YIM 98692]|uniref:YhcN/YlaJ family sporulation lipoprotein n=1 Tax=Gracilibacillus sp. YIM 98692 TaxID=2663532 RepID=UPI0013D51617|nr:YhcN/YlaJ family sporulation lipoprotein [Gracilibacillus sp. YIM 98692]
MHLKKPALTLVCAATLSLVACGGNEYGQDDPEYGNNTQPIGYNQTSNNPALDRDQNRDQNPATGQHPEQRQNGDNEFMFDGNTNRDDNNGTNARRNGNNYEVADEAAERIEQEIPEVDNVYVLTTDNNAYVAAGWDKDNNRTNNNDDLNDNVEDKITRTVKSVNDNIDNVYITTNPDFFDLADRYANDADNGEPVEGFFNRMGNMIERIFPDRNE